MFDSSSEATTNLQLVTKSVDGGSFKTPRDYDGSTVGSFDDSTISTRRTLRSKDTRITTRSIVSASSTPSYALTKSNHARRASYSLRKSDKKKDAKDDDKSRSGRSSSASESKSSNSSDTPSANNLSRNILVHDLLYLPQRKSSALVIPAENFPKVDNNGCISTRCSKHVAKNQSLSSGKNKKEKSKK